MEHIEIGHNTSWQHNAYDRYNCSWEIIMGLGGSGAFNTTDTCGVADDCDSCKHLFLDAYDESFCDYEGPTKFGLAYEKWDMDYVVLLQYLSETPESIQDKLNDSEKGVYVYWANAGGYCMEIKFERTADGVVVETEGNKFIVDNLT